MKKLISAFCRSWWFPIMRILTAGVSLFIILGGIEMIDLTGTGLPEEFFAITFAASILFAFLFGLLYEQVNYHAALDHKGLTAAEYPKDRRYQLGTLVSIIIAVGIAMYVAPLVIDTYVIGAGMWTYAVVAAIIAGIAAPCVEFIIHCGLREFLVRAREYAKDIVPEIKKTGEEIVDSIVITKKEE